jgi:hypothetical protein
MRAFIALVFCIVVFAAELAAQRATRARAVATRFSTLTECAAELGSGLKSRRTFCDVIVAIAPAASVEMSIPPHAGTTTLMFDLHNRFTLPALAVPGALAFARHEAKIAVIRPDGQVVGRAAVVREFRSVLDVFDQLGGGTRPGGAKAIAPGPAEAVKFVLPAAVNAVGIVGTRLKVLSRAGEETFDTPGRPVAIVSNLRIEFTPAK